MNPTPAQINTTALSIPVICSVLLHVCVLAGGLLFWQETAPPLTTADALPFEIIMESPSPGHGEGIAQQQVKATPPEPAQNKEESPALKDNSKPPVAESKWVHDAPSSPLGDIVLQRKPPPPKKQQSPKKQLKAAKPLVLKNIKQAKPAQDDLKGKTEGQRKQGTHRPAGLQHTGNRGEIKAAQYRLGSALNPKPAYPRLARNRGWQGRVILEVEVSEQGHPVHIRIVKSSGHKVLDRAALKAMKKWTFTPAQKAGIHVASHLNIPIRFDLINS